MKRRVISAFACVAGLSLAGCGHNTFVGRPGLAVVQQEGLPVPQASDFGTKLPYSVGPLDRITVDVYGAPDVSRTVQVDANGTAAMPLIGSFNALGKTPSELSQIIKQRLLRYIRNPDVTVSIDTVAQTVTVDGQVAKPGLYPMLGRMTLMRAIASAEGANEFADTSYVVVFRRAGGKELAGLYDLRAIRQGIYADPDIYPNDIVYVGDSPGRRVFQSVVQSGALLTAPLVAILN